MYTETADSDISLTDPARVKFAQLVEQVEEDVKGVRVYAVPGGCSGISFGMTFANQIDEADRLF